MNKKLILSFVSVLLPVLFIVGWMGLSQVNKPLKALENEAKLVEATIDGKEVNSETTIQEQEVIVDLASVKEVYLSLTYNEQIQVVPLTKKDEALSMNPESETTVTEFNLADWKEQFQSAKDTALEEKAETTGLTLVKAEKSGAYYFRLKPGISQRFRVTYQAKNTQPIVVYEASEENPAQQTLFNFISLNELTSEATGEQEDKLIRAKRSTSAEASELNLQSDNPLAIFRLHTEEPDYQIGEDALGYVTLAMNRGTGTLTDSIVEIRIPKVYTKNKPSGSMFGLSKTVDTIEEGDDWIIRYSIPIISGGYNGKVPFRVATSNGVTPSGYVMPIKARILNEDNQTLSQSTASVTWTTVLPSIEKNISGVREGVVSSSYFDKAYFEGGFEDPENKGYFYGEDHLDQLKPVQYFFKVRTSDADKGVRDYDGFEIVETLPKDALFRQEDNPDWKYDSETKEVKYTETKKLYSSDTRDKLQLGNDSELETPKLVVYYPKAKIGASQKNIGTATFFPMGKASYEKNPTVGDEIINPLTGTQKAKKPGDYLEYRKSSNGDVYDVQSLKEAIEPKFYMYMHLNAAKDSKFDRQVKNATIRDFSLDDQLYFTRMVIYSTKDALAMKGTASVKVVLQNDEEVVLSTNLPIGSSGSSKGSEIKIPENLQKQVKEVIATANEGTIMLPGSSFYMDVYTKYRNPAASLKNNLDDDPSNDVRNTMDNLVRFSGNFVDNDESFESGAWKGTHKLTAVDQRVALLKRMVSTTDVFWEDTVDYALNIYFTDILKGMTFDEPVVVDLLPTGLDYVPKSTVISKSSNATVTFDNENYDKEPEVIPNYQHTGRTALIWRLPSGTAQTDNLEKNTGFAYNSYTKGEVVFPELESVHKKAYVQIAYKTQANIHTIEGDNLNDAYLSWDNQEEVSPLSTSEAAWQSDSFDIDEDGNVTDKVYHSSTNFGYRPPTEIVAVKEAQGNLDTEYVSRPNTAKTEIGSTANYRLLLLNNSAVSEKYVTFLDVLPFVGDRTVGEEIEGDSYERNSQYQVSLSGPVKVPKGFKDLYSSTPPPPIDGKYAKFYAGEKFVSREEVKDFSKVRAFKIVMDEGKTLQSRDQLEVIVPVSIPKDYDLKDGMLANNSYGVTHSITGAQNPLWYESSVSSLEIVRYQVTGKVFNDFNLDSEINDSESGIANHKVALVDEKGNPVLDLEGKPITASTTTDGMYTMDVFRQGNYRVKILPPEGYELTQPKEGVTMSNIELDENVDDVADNWKENLSDPFELDVMHRNAIRNAGYYSAEKEIHLYKYDADSVYDTNADSKIDDEDRKLAHPLKDAVFEVYEGRSIDASKRLKDEKGKVMTLTTDESGTTSFSADLNEDYTLLEVKAPTGFELSKEPIYVTNVETEQDDELWVYIANHPQTELPFAGSNRPLQMLIILFSSFMLIGLVIVIYQFGPKKRGV